MSIFISHSNVARGVEPVFDALIDEKQGLRSKLGDEYAAYELFWDRQIEAAADWRACICEKLCVCAAAVILLSKEAFEPERWWVRFETFFLTTLKSGSRQICVSFPCISAMPSRCWQRARPSMPMICAGIRRSGSRAMPD